MAFALAGLGLLPKTRGCCLRTRRAAPAPALHCAPRSPAALRRPRRRLTAVGDDDAAPAERAAEAAPAEQSAEEVQVAASLGVPPAPAPAPAPPFALQELVNARAAMLGFVLCAGVELASGRSVYSQVFREVLDDGVVKHGVEPRAFLGIAAVVVSVTLSSVAPLVFSEPGQTFTPLHLAFSEKAERQNGRAAMLGMAGLLVSEALMGQAFF